jgi:hypothetical protein
MDFDSIRDFCCAKVGKTDDYTKARATDFITARHRTIYESFPWKTAQTIVTLTADGNGETSQDTLEVTEVSHIISVRVAGELLDPVATSYVFESAKDDFNTPDTNPRYYDVFYSAIDQTPTIRFYPPLKIDADAGRADYEVVILGKLPLDDNATHVAVPHTENALIAYVLGDLWEYLHQVGKAQAKFTEAQGLLQSAQTADTPAPMRPRMSVPLTATGNTLQELTDSVCNIIGKFDPDTRVSVKERIRRNYQVIADSALWPELSIMASADVVGGNYVVLPTHFDKVIAVRTNVSTDDIIHAPYQLSYRDAQVWFGLQPGIFEATDKRISYSMLPPVATETLITGDPESLSFVLSLEGQPELINVFVRGFINGNEIYETVAVRTFDEEDPIVTTQNFYDEVVTISKPITRGVLTVTGSTSTTTYLELRPAERENKHLRLWLLPQDFDSGELSSASDERLASVLVFGKMRIQPLIDDQDSCQIRDVENVLINATAADMLLQSGQSDQAAMLKAKSEQSMATLVSALTQQQAYEPRIMPYTEPDNNTSWI